VAAKFDEEGCAALNFRFRLLSESKRRKHIAGAARCANQYSAKNYLESPASFRLSPSQQARLGVPATKCPASASGCGRGEGTRELAACVPPVPSSAISALRVWHL